MKRLESQKLYKSSKQNLFQSKTFPFLQPKLYKRKRNSRISLDLLWEGMRSHSRFEGITNWFIRIVSPKLIHLSLLCRVMSNNLQLNLQSLEKLFTKFFFSIELFLICRCFNNFIEIFDRLRWIFDESLEKFS